jgi:hypothetical protein
MNCPEMKTRRGPNEQCKLRSACSSSLVERLTNLRFYITRISIKTERKN